MPFFLSFFLNIPFLSFLINLLFPFQYSPHYLSFFFTCSFFNGCIFSWRHYFRFQTIFFPSFSYFHSFLLFLNLLHVLYTFFLFLYWLIFLLFSSILSSFSLLSFLVTFFIFFCLFFLGFCRVFMYQFSFDYFINGKVNDPLSFFKITLNNESDGGEIKLCLN